MAQLRIVTWNIAEGIFRGDEMATLAAIARCLRNKNPDIVLLNEVCRWWYSVDQVWTLARLAGYGYGNSTYTATKFFSRGTKCVAVLSRIPLLSAERIQHSSYFDGGGYATLHVTARLDNRVHHIFSTRFTAYDPAENARSHATLRDIIANLPSEDAVIIGGDFNTGYGAWDANGQRTLSDTPLQYPDFVVGTRLRHVLGDIGWESPSPDDHLLIRGVYDITEAERLYPEPDLSDHPWVFAELSLPGFPLKTKPAPPFYDGITYLTTDAADRIEVHVEENAVAADSAGFVLNAGPGINWRKEIVIVEGAAAGAGRWTIYVADNRNTDGNGLYTYQLPGARLEFRKAKFWSGITEVSRIRIDTVKPGSRITFTWVRD